MLNIYTRSIFPGIHMVLLESIVYNVGALQNSISFGYKLTSFVGKAPRVILKDRFH